VVGIDVLTDTHGADLSSYKKEIVQQICSSTVSGDSASESAANQTAHLMVTIDRSGKMTALCFGQHTHTVELDRAAWTAVSRQQSFPPLPEAFAGSSLNLEIRIRAF
jgi:hypothetical protein